MDCIKGVKLEERINKIEVISDMKDEANERTLMNIKGLFEKNQKETEMKFEKLEDKIDNLDNKIDKLEKSIPDTVERTITGFFNKVGGKVVKWVIVVCVGAVVIAIFKEYGLALFSTKILPWLISLF